MADSILITAAELAGALASGKPLAVLDVRWNIAGPPGIDAYTESHVPTAAFVDLDRDLCAAPGDGGRHPLPDPADFELAMRRAGVARGMAVVVYDAANSSAGAARAWWALRYFGHAAVRVLDGGYAAWTAGAYRTDSGLVTPAPGDFVARPGHMPVLTADAAVTLVERGGILIDARVAERFRGETEPIDPVAGHIPGAKNLPAADLVRTSGQFLAQSDLRARFATIGASDELVVGAYCGSGITAAHTVLAAAVAGFDVSLYPGSWSEWIRDSTRPVATGAA